MRSLKPSIFANHKRTRSGRHRRHHRQSSHRKSIGASTGRRCRAEGVRDHRMGVSEPVHGAGQALHELEKRGPSRSGEALRRGAMAGASNDTTRYPAASSGSTKASSCAARAAPPVHEVDDRSIRTPDRSAHRAAPDCHGERLAGGHWRSSVLGRQGCLGTVSQIRSAQRAPGPGAATSNTGTRYAKHGSRAVFKHERSCFFCEDDEGHGDPSLQRWESISRANARRARSSAMASPSRRCAWK